MLIGTFVDALDELRRNGWILHAVDAAVVRQQASPGADGPQQTLLFLAHQTGGELVANDNGFAHGITRSLGAGTYSYLLGVPAGEMVQDGRFDSLEDLPRHAGQRRRAEAAGGGGRRDHRAGPAPRAAPRRRAPTGVYLLELRVAERERVTVLQRPFEVVTGG
ncbi:MAG TPA: hypothetical protein VMT16_01825 [Thermoanaerobaculia bacterium]|nr:hypothetical protein [Thermoanaerobaculia bacterium]